MSFASEPSPSKRTHANEMAAVWWFHVDVVVSVVVWVSTGTEPYLFRRIENSMIIIT